MPPEGTHTRNCLAECLLAKETDHETIKQDLKEHLRDADFTLECLMHMLTDLKSEHPLIQDMDKTDIGYFIRAIDKGFETRGAELKERQKEARILIVDILNDVLDPSKNQRSIKEDWSRQHDIWTKCQKARYLLGETDEMDVTWSMVEFHADHFFDPKGKAEVSDWCWITFPFKFYYNSVRLRASFQCWITLVLSFSVFAGLLTETFMSTFTPLSMDRKFKFHCYLCTLPFMMILFAFFCEGAVILAFDSAKSVPLIKIAAAFLQGLQFFTLPRFVIWIFWITTSAAGLQHFSSLFVKILIPNPQFRDPAEAAAKLCLVLILFVIEIFIIKLLRPGLTDEEQKTLKKLESEAADDNKETQLKKKLEEKKKTGITLAILREAFRNELKVNPCRKKVLLFFYCLLTGIFVIWRQHGIAFWSFGMGLFCILFMMQLESGEEQNWVPTLWQRQVVDVSFLLLVEIVPLLSGIWGACFWGRAADGRGPAGAFFRSYLWGGVFSVMVATAIFQMCNAQIAGSIFWSNHMTKEKAQPEAKLYTRPDSISSYICTSLESVSSLLSRASNTNHWKSYGEGRKRFRVGAELEIHKKLESMFYRDRVPPGMLSQIPKCIYELTVKEIEQHSVCFEAYVHELFDEGVPVWKYLWYSSLAILLGVLLRAVQIFEKNGNEGSNLKILIWRGTACIILSIILCGTRLSSSSFWSCLKRCGYICCSKSVQGVPVWKYLWYLSFAILLGVLLRVVQDFEAHSHEGSNLTSLKLTGTACIILCIILCGARWFSGSFWSCLKHCCCCCCPKSVNQNIYQCRFLTTKCVKRHLEVHKPVILVVVVWLVAVFGSWKFEETNRQVEAKDWIPVVCPCFLLLAAFASLAAENKAPGLVGHIYWKLVWLFAMVITLILIIPIFRLPPTGASVPIVGNNDPKYEPRTGDGHQYDLCNWKHGPEPLTALDMATFAGLTYETNNTIVEENLSSVFSGREVNMTASNESEYPRYVVFDIGNEKKTRVIAFKGTSTSKDIYLDMTLFSIIKILQGFECIFPVIDLFPLDQIQWFLYRAHLFGQRDTEEEFWENTHKLTRKWATSQWANRTILTGHSLGGLIAQIMAARLNVPALVFSSPGVKYSADRFRIHDLRYWRDDYAPGKRPGAGEFGVQVLKSKVRNVIPDRDAVPRVDEQISLVDHIECRDGLSNTSDTENTRPFAPKCHMLTRTACELWLSCGDIHKREFDCHDYHDGPKDFNEWDSPDDNT